MLAFRNITTVHPSEAPYLDRLYGLDDLSRLERAQNLGNDSLMQVGARLQVSCPDAAVVGSLDALIDNLFIAL